MLFESYMGAQKKDKKNKMDYLKKIFALPFGWSVDKKEMMEEQL